MEGRLQSIIRAALQEGRPNSRNLSAFAMDVVAYLEQTGLFTKIIRKKSGNPACALVVTCRLHDPFSSPAEVAQRLVHVWNDAPLGYGGIYDAHQVAEHLDRVELRFVTMADSGAVVTGLIEVTGFQH
jgi:hypothetical protein